MKAIQQISKLKASQVESGWSILRKMQRKYKLNGKFFIVSTFWYKRNSKMKSSFIINVYVHHGVTRKWNQDSMLNSVMLVTIGNIAFARQESFINKLFITFSMCLSKGKVNIDERGLCLILPYIYYFFILHFTFLGCSVLLRSLTVKVELKWIVCTYLCS